MKLPYYPMHVQDFDESPRVLSMSLAEVGLYVLALNESWKRGSIPNDPEELALLVRRRASEVKKAWPKIRECFVVNGSPDRLINERQEVERGKALNRSKVATENVQKRYAGNYRGNYGGKDSVGLLVVPPNTYARLDSVSVVSEVSKKTSLPQNQDFDPLARFERFRAKHPGVKTRAGDCRSQYVNIVLDSPDPIRTADSLDAHQSKWLEYWNNSSTLPLGLYNFLAGGDCMEDPPESSDIPECMRGVL